MSSELKEQAPSLADQNDWVRAVASLIRLTEEGKLKWKSADAPRLLQEQQVDVVFTAEYEGKRLRLHKEFTKYVFGEVILELGDTSEQGWYTIPQTEAAKELLESVEYQVYGVDDFLTRILDAGGSSNRVRQN